MNDLLEVVSLVKTCDFFPAQWEGHIKDGRMFYIRYRWGNFNAYLSKESTNQVQDAIRGELLLSIDNYGDDFDGELEDNTMMEILQSKLDFSSLK